MLGPVASLFAQAKTAGLVASTALMQPKDLPTLPLLTVADRVLDSFEFAEDGVPTRARLRAELLLVTPLSDGADAADAAELALFEVLPGSGFTPVSSGQVEANWRREVIICRVVVTTQVSFNRTD